MRRHEPTVGDIDIVCTSDDAAAVITAFTHWERAEAVLAEGGTKASIWLEDGLQIDLRVLATDVYGNLLQHFTGSREHNIQLRELAVRKNLRVSENGIVDLTDGRLITCRTEAEVYVALGLLEIPPEMRLGIGEIEAARDGTLPTSVALADLRGDFHMHCTWSDGADTLEAMIAAAAAPGLHVPCHLGSLGGARAAGLSAEQLRRQRRRCERWASARDADPVLGRGRHPRRRRAGLPRRDPGRAGHGGGQRPSGPQPSREEMTARLIRACENRYVTMIGHPTGRNVEAPFAGDEFDYDAVFAAAARTGTALEIDGQPSRLDLPNAWPGAPASSA